MTASQATCADRETRNIDQPQRKAAIGPYASRKKTYWPPVDGNAAPSSAHASAPKKDVTPARVQTARIKGVDDRLLATRLGTRKIPPPMTMPTTMARESNSPSLRGSSLGEGVVSIASFPGGG